MDQEVEIEGGRLFIVSTPIGNLGDITQRAINVLGAVDVIYAEDTRKSRVLFDYYKIDTPVKSYHDFNKEKVTPFIISSLLAQKSVAVVSDAGTPGISDPAFYLVRSAIQKHITVEAVPGATAFVPALIVSGLPSDRFVFEGFLPVKKGRKTRLEFLATEPRTMIFYESPKRIERTLHDLILTLGDRNAAIVRELTKKFEQIERGRLTDLLENSDRIPKKGEFVLVVEGLTRKTKR
ncbi:16S rRNA (cytidine(1402)-2'-O)-methyltransferase [candidate division KSB1 bacterium]|nr:16S rRNA (cytidine(1402)-2'-O)-methyltransferase [candidate division KSB1 bacterium]